MAAAVAVIAMILAWMSYKNSRVLRRKRMGADYRTTGELVWRRVLSDYLPPLLIVLFLSLYAASGTLSGSVATFMQLVKQTVHPVIQGPFYGTSVLQIWFSVRLIVIAIAISACGAWLLFLVRAAIRKSAVRAVVEPVFAMMESVPDALYVIACVLLVIVLVDDYGIVLPAFTDGNPGWMDTWIPAFVLALPAVFAIQRLLYLRYSDEVDAQYTQTAIAKGASRNYTVVRHVLPNVVPSFLHALPGAAAMVVSSSLFVEFFMEYKGQLSHFLQGVGEGAMDGLPTVIASGGNPVIGPDGHLEYYYYAGTLFVIGAFLVLMWVLLTVGFGWISKAAYPQELTRMPTAVQKKINWVWVGLGTTCLLAIITVGVWPGLLTHWGPNYEDLTSSVTMPPISPNHLHPFGTDAMGRDFLSRTLQGTIPSLLTTGITTVGTIVLSLALCFACFLNPTGKVSAVARRVSQMLSAVPTLFIVFLALYPENRVVAEWYGRSSPHYFQQALWFIVWIAVVEAGKFSYELKHHMEEWYSFSFVESAIAIGRGRIAILLTHLRSWFGRYLLEFTLTEFVRIMSLMTQLAALHIYFQEEIGLLPFKPITDLQQWPQGIVSATPTWFGMIGEATMSMPFISYPFYLEGPLAALFITMVSVHLIAHGIRGRETN